jgi:hypothetical protein
MTFCDGRVMLHETGGVQMRKPMTHDQALRAALQVARGNRRQTAAAATGLIMLGGCGDVSDTTNSPDDVVDSADVASTSGDAEALVDALDMAAEDALGAEVQATEDTSTAPEPDVATDASATETADVESVDAAGLADAAATEDTTAMHDGMTASDDGVEGDAEGEADAAVECIDGCWQPNGTACTEHMDCAVLEDVIGACTASGEECVQDWQCLEGEVCEGGAQAISPNLDPETGELYEFSSGVACFDGMCHEGAQISAAAQACCSFGGEEQLPWCDEQAILGGCTPWGPPAPPAYDGTTLAQRMQRWLS